MNESKRQWIVLGVCGAIVAAVAILLAAFGNPKNMAICVACFLRDTAGGLKLHSASAVQYIRPETLCIMLGALGAALAGREFRAQAGSSPVLRFLLGAVVMVGCLVFLGCPLRMVLRMAGGDLNAWVALVGFALGILTGVLFLRRGFTLGRAHDVAPAEGAAFPVVALVILVLSVATTVFVASTEGPGSIHAPVALSIIAGLVFGAAAQKSRMCFAGSLRDAFMVRDFSGLVTVGILFVGVLVYNLVTGNFNLSFEGQPIAHTEALWNILGMYVVGFGVTLLGGCPLRQLVLAGQGNSDAACTVLGLIVGAAFCHNFGLASSGTGTTEAGQIACVVCIAVLFVVAIVNIKKH